MIHVREESDLAVTRSACSRRLKDKGSCRDSVRAVAKKSSTALWPSHAIERLFLSASAESSAYSPADKLMDNRGFDVGMRFPEPVLHLAAWCGTYQNMSILSSRRDYTCVFKELDRRRHGRADVQLSCYRAAASIGPVGVIIGGGFPAFWRYACGVFLHSRSKSHAAHFVASGRIG